MSDPYGAGAVWQVKVDFKDGKGERPKYIVLLSNLVQPGDFFVAAFTTSQGEKRYLGETTLACGCPACQCFRIEPKQEACFPLTTWVQFDNLCPVEKAKLDSMEKEGRAVFLQMLAAERIRAVLRCALRSPDLAGKFSAQVSRSLKALNAPPAKALAPSPLAKVKSALASHGPSCIEAFAACLKSTAEELSKILAEQAPQPDKFLEEAEVALQLVAEDCQCPGRKP